MEINEAAHRPLSKTGRQVYWNVQIDPLFDPPGPVRAFGASVTFEPGARGLAHPPA
jgi:hypothetical protein